jgi:hypothetical protein
VVPVAAVVMAKTLPLPVAVKTAILVLAISAGAPLLPRKLMKLGREGYVFSLVVTSSLLAVVAVPAWLEGLGTLFGREADLDPAAVALVVAKAFLAPLVLGMLLRWPLSASRSALGLRRGGRLTAMARLSAAVARSSRWTSSRFSPATTRGAGDRHALGVPTRTIARRSPCPAPRARRHRRFRGIGARPGRGRGLATPASAIVSIPTCAGGRGCGRRLRGAVIRHVAAG